LVFPNPVSENIFIQMKDCSSPDISVKLTDAVGNEVISFKEQNTCDRMFKVDVSRVAPGAYFLQIRSGENCITKKIMVMH